MDRKPIFDAVRAMRGRSFTRDEVETLDRAIDRTLGSQIAQPQASRPRRLGAAGIDLIKKWEGCHRALPDGRFAAYPDPGSADGDPWTIGWGSTGRGIGPGTVWTRDQCDERLARDLERYAAEVADAIGDAPTCQNQFDALVSFHYNTGAVFRATLTRKHVAGRFAEAAEEFHKWIYNNGKPMRGLRKRRDEEALLYASRGGDTG